MNPRKQVPSIICINLNSAVVDLNDKKDEFNKGIEI